MLKKDIESVSYEIKIIKSIHLCVRSFGIPWHTVSQKFPLSIIFTAIYSPVLFEKGLISKRKSM